MTSQNTVNFSDQELRASIFWVKNEVKLFKIFRFLVYILNIIFWGYVIWGLLDAYIISYPRESKLSAEIVNNQKILAKIVSDQPVNITTSRVLVFNNTENRRDIAVDIKNSNQDWWAEFDYQFSLSGEETAKHHDFILPQEANTLTELGFKPKTKGSRQAKLIISNLHWHRIDPNQVYGSYKDFIKKRFSNVKVSNIKSKQIQLGDKKILQTSFDIINNGAYGFWSIDYIIKLKRSSNTIAVNKINIKNLKPGDIKHIELRWFDNISATTKTEITPHINLLNPHSYLDVSDF